MLRFNCAACSDHTVRHQPVLLCALLRFMQPKKRRLLIELLVKLIDNPQNVWGLLSVGSPIVLYDDLEWIVEKIEIEGILEKKAVWAQIL